MICTYYQLVCTKTRIPYRLRESKVELRMFLGCFWREARPLVGRSGVGAESVFSCIACVGRRLTQEALQAFQNNSLLEESSMPASASS